MATEEIYLAQENNTLPAEQDISHHPKTVTQAIGTLNFIGMLVLGAIGLMVVANIIVRFFGFGIRGTHDFVQLFIVIPAAFSLPFAALHQMHISVHILVSRLQHRSKAIVATVTSLLSLGFLAIAVWAEGSWAWQAQLENETTFSAVEIAIWPFRYVLTLGLILLGVVTLSDTFHLIAKKERTNESN